MSKYSESQENYIETIHVLSRTKPVVRSVDVANELGFKKPSISIAMKTLREEGLITITPEGYIYLTPQGLALAESVYDRHVTLTQALINIGVPADIAEEDACRVEHVISPETFAAVKKHVKK